MADMKAWDVKRWEAIGLDSMPTKAYDVVRLELTPGQVLRLMESGFINPADSQNDSPTAREFLEFGSEQEFLAPGSVRFEAYVVSAHRPDRRISIEGVTCRSSLETRCWGYDRRPDEMSERYEGLGGPSVRMWWD